MPIFYKEGKAIFFVHIPKTAGRTIESRFQASGYQLSYIDMDGQGLNRFHLCSPQHMDASQYTRIFDLSTFEIVFAVVRDPISRLKSEVAMRLQANFQNKVDQNDQWVLDAFERYQANSYVYDNHLKPQSEFIVPGVQVFRLEDGVESILSLLESKCPGLRLAPGDEHVGSRKEKSGFLSADVKFSDSVSERVREFYLSDYRRFYPELVRSSP
jgi:hypothetical protein